MACEPTISPVPPTHPSRREMCAEAGIAWRAPGYRDRLAAVRESLPCVIAWRREMAAWEAEHPAPAPAPRMQAVSLSPRESYERWARRVAAREARAAELARERRNLLARLRSRGFRREHSSGRGGSVYYRRGVLVVRVSDHEVPMTADREHSLQHGGRSWSGSRWSYVLGETSSEAWIAEVDAWIAQHA